MRDDGTSARDPLFLGATCGATWNWRRNHYYHPFDDYGCTPPGPHSYYRRRLREKLEDVRHAVHEWFYNDMNLKTTKATAYMMLGVLKETMSSPMLHS